MHLIENQEQLARIARELVTRTLDRESFLVQASLFTRDHPEISNLVWVDAARRNIAGYSGTSFPAETGISGVDTPASMPVERPGNAPENAFEHSRDTRQSAYSPAFTSTASATPCSSCRSPCSTGPASTAR